MLLLTTLLWGLLLLRPEVVRRHTSEAWFVELTEVIRMQYYVKRKKCKVNDVIFPSGCEARAINLDNKNMKIGIFTGSTSVRSKTIKLFSQLFHDILPESMK